MHLFTYKCTLCPCDVELSIEDNLEFQETIKLCPRCGMQMWKRVVAMNAPSLPQLLTMDEDFIDEEEDEEYERRDP